MRLMMLGTGSAFGKKYFNNNALLKTDNGELIAIDFGVTAPISLHQLNMNIGMIDHYIITHIHADHVGGLEEVAFMNRYVFNKKPKLFLPFGLKDLLWEETLKGGLRETNEGICELEDYFEVIEGNDFSIGNYEFSLFQTNHVKDKLSYSVKITEEVDVLYTTGKKNFLYTSDVIFEDWLVETYHQYDVIFHDCQLFKGGVHASLEELLTLDSNIQERILIMHYGDNIGDFIDELGKMKRLEQHMEYIF